VLLQLLMLTVMMMMMIGAEFHQTLWGKTFLPTLRFFRFFFFSFSSSHSFLRATAVPAGTAESAY